MHRLHLGPEFILQLLHPRYEIDNVCVAQCAALSAAVRIPVAEYIDCV